MSEGGGGDAPACSLTTETATPREQCDPTRSNSGGAVLSISAVACSARLSLDLGADTGATRLDSSDSGIPITAPTGSEDSESQGDLGTDLSGDTNSEQLAVSPNGASHAASPGPDTDYGNSEGSHIGLFTQTKPPGVLADHGSRVHGGVGVTRSSSSDSYAPLVGQTIGGSVDFRAPGEEDGDDSLQNPSAPASTAGEEPSSDTVSRPLNSRASSTEGSSSPPDNDRELGPNVVSQPARSEPGDDAGFWDDAAEDDWVVVGRRDRRGATPTPPASQPLVVPPAVIANKYHALLFEDDTEFELLIPDEVPEVPASFWSTVARWSDPGNNEHVDNWVESGSGRLSDCADIPEVDAHRSICAMYNTLAQVPDGEVVALLVYYGSFCPFTKGHAQTLIEGRRVVLGASDRYAACIGVVSLRSDESVQCKMYWKGCTHLPLEYRQGLIRIGLASYPWAALEHDISANEVREMFYNISFETWVCYGADVAAESSFSRERYVVAGRQGDTEAVRNRIKQMAGSWWSPTVLLGDELPDISSTKVRIALVQRDRATLEDMLHADSIEWHIGGNPQFDYTGHWDGMPLPG